MGASLMGLGAPCSQDTRRAPIVKESVCAIQGTEHATMELGASPMKGGKYLVKDWVCPPCEMIAPISRVCLSGNSEDYLSLRPCSLHEV